MRIVSLCPSLTELLFDLGVGPQVVGRTRFCVHPADGVAEVPTLGGTKNPKLDRIVELAPDLVFMNEEENRREDADALQAAGLRVEASLPRTVEETAQMIRDIATSVDAAAEGELLANRLERTAADVRDRARHRPRVRYAYLIWREPWMAVNDETFIASMLRTAGGENVFGAAVDRYPMITLEALGAAAPDTILLSSEPFPFAERHAEELAEALGCSRDRLQFVDGELLSWHGARAIRGLAYAEEVLNASRRRR